MDLIITWIEDTTTVGSQEVLDETKKKLMIYFKCEDGGEILEYVSNKLTCLEDRGALRKKTKTKQNKPEQLTSSYLEFS